MSIGIEDVFGTGVVHLGANVVEEFAVKISALKVFNSFIVDQFVEDKFDSMNRKLVDDLDFPFDRGELFEGGDEG